MYFAVEQCEPQQIEGLDLVFILDASGSIGSGNFGRMKTTVINIVNSLTIGPDKSRVAVVRYSSSATLLFNLNTYTQKNTLIQAINGIEFTGGGTNTAAALAVLRSSIFSEILGVRSDFESTKIAVVITDGKSSNRQETANQASMLHTQDNFQIYAIGIGDNIDETELNSIASESNNVILLEDFTATELQRLETAIIEGACEGIITHT